MKILVTGANGQLGREIIRQGTEYELFLTCRETLDITDMSTVAKFMKELQPDAVIHCAAYTNVDGAESDPDGAFRVNVVGTQNIASGCLETGARLVYVSTDYVFDGLKREPYREFDTVNPQTVYGVTKLHGEEMVRRIVNRHYIVRTAWLYGDGNNFVKSMLKLTNQSTQLKVVNDQVGTPTSTKDLTQVIFRILNSDSYGTYHATCQGNCSWFDFATEIFRQLNINIDVVPVTTAEFARPANRPQYSVLDNYMLRMTVGDTMRLWQDALKDYLRNQY